MLLAQVNYWVNSPLPVSYTHLPEEVDKNSTLAEATAGIKGKVTYSGGTVKEVAASDLSFMLVPVSYTHLRNYRLDISRKMMADKTSNRNITEIAYRVGFNDPKYFTRCFTKQFGISPTAYKDQFCLLYTSRCV